MHFETRYTHYYLLLLFSKYRNASQIVWSIIFPMNHPCAINLRLSFLYTITANCGVDYGSVAIIVVNGIIGFTIYVIVVTMRKRASIKRRKLPSTKSVYLDINPTGDGFK